MGSTRGAGINLLAPASAITPEGAARALTSLTVGVGSVAAIEAGNSAAETGSSAPSAVPDKHANEAKHATSAPDAFPAVMDHRITKTYETAHPPDARQTSRWKKLSAPLPRNT